MPEKKNKILKGVHGLPDDPSDIIDHIRNVATPLEMVEARPGRDGQVFYYLRHQWVTDVLNALTRYNWDMRVVREYLDPPTQPNFVSVLVEITLRVTYHGKDATIVKQQWGSAEVKRYRDGRIMSPGDDLKAAASDGKKKAAMELGLGADLALPVKSNHLKALHATGRRVFDDAWDAVRPVFVRTITEGRKHEDGSPITSSKDLMDIEARLITAAIDKQHNDHNLPLVQGLADLLREAGSAKLKAYKRENS
jgi:hypothetical protein